MKRTIDLTNYEITLLISGINNEIEAEQAEIKTGDKTYNHEKEINRLESIRRKLFQAKEQ